MNVARVGDARAHDEEAAARRIRCVLFVRCGEVITAGRKLDGIAPGDVALRLDRRDAKLAREDEVGSVDGRAMPGDAAADFREDRER